MQRRSNALVAAGMPITRLLSRRHIEIALAYLAGYFLLDWLSYVHPYASFGITPWIPPSGLSFALILLFGAKFVPWLFIAPVLADARARPAAADRGGAVGIDHHRRRLRGRHQASAAPQLRFDPSLTSRQSLLLLMMVAVISTAMVAGAYVGRRVAFGMLPRLYGSGSVT